MENSSSAAALVTSRPGVYALILELRGELSVRAGRVRGLLPPGVYVYIGSARGPGGVKARVLRHMKREKKIKWHVDQLTAAARIAGVVFAETNSRECVLTPHLEKLGFEHLLPGFGSSDCTSGCRSHLFSRKTSSEAAIESAEKAFRRAGLEPRTVAL